MTLFLKPTEDASEVPLCFGLLGLRGLNLIPYLLRRVRLFSKLFAQITINFPQLALQCVQYSGLLSLIYFLLVCAATFVLNWLMLLLLFL